MLRRALAAEAAAVETWWKGCGVASRRLSTSALPRACVTNLKTLNYDNGIDLTRLSKVADVTSHDYSTTEEIIERTKGFDVAITKEVPVTADTIAKLDPSIKIICEAGTGFNNIDLEAAKAKGITVTNVPDYSSDGVAHLALTYMLNFSCSMVPQQRMNWEGDRKVFSQDVRMLRHVELTGRTLGLIGGAGVIGSKLAKIAIAMGMRVVDSSLKVTGEIVPGVEYKVPFEQVLAESDYVSVHCPLNDSTRHLINAEALAMMKPTAYIINAARGPIIKEDDLVHALQNGVIAGAGLDVHEVEPLRPDSPLFDLPNAVLTPHIGWQRLESRQRLMDVVADSIEAFTAGQPINTVN